MSLRFAATFVAAIVVTLVVGAAISSAPRATAQDAQTDAMIWHFNVYRVQHGLPPLYTHPDMSTLLQTSAQQSADACGPSIPARPSYAQKWTFFAENGGETADIRWNYDWSMDPNITSRLEDPEFNSVGVGRALSHCSQGWTWTAALAEVSGAPNGNAPTPTGPVTPSPVPTPTPATVTPPPTIAATPTPTLAATPTPASPSATTATTAPTPTATATPAPTTTAAPTNSGPSSSGPINGDANCDGLVRTTDGMLVLFLAADFSAPAPCLGLHGVDCTGLIDSFDALALFRYLAGVDPGIPNDCTPIGQSDTTPTPTVVPTNAVTPTEGPTLPATITATPVATLQAGSILHCFLAVASYDLMPHDGGPLFSDAACSTDIGVDYACDFPGESNTFTCDSDSPSMPDRQCYTYQQQRVFCGVGAAVGANYQCDKVQSVSHCAPVEDTSSPTYDCVVDDPDVNCLTESESFPDIHCARVEQNFACAVIP